MLDYCWPYNSNLCIAEAQKIIVNGCYWKNNNLYFRVIFVGLGEFVQKQRHCCKSCGGIGEVTDDA